MKLWVISSSLLILFTILLRRLLRGRITPGLQYGLWLLVLVRLLVPGNVLFSPVSVAQVVQGLDGKQTTVSTQAYEFQRNTAHYTYFVDEYVQPSNQAIDDQVDFGRILTAVWLVGVATTGFALIWNNLKFYFKLRSSRTPRFPAEKPPIYEAPALSSPCLFGVLCPAIYLPCGLSLSPEDVCHVLAHERAHFRHGDHIWALLRSIALSLHWYNPLVWAAVILSKQDSELASDAAAIRFLGESNRVAYGQTLLRLITAAPKSTDPLSCATTMSSGRKNLEQRIRMIVKSPKMLTATAVSALLLVILMAAITLTSAPESEPYIPNTAANSMTIFHHHVDAIIVLGEKKQAKSWNCSIPRKYRPHRSPWTHFTGSPSILKKRTVLTLPGISPLTVSAQTVNTWETTFGKIANTRQSLICTGKAYIIKRCG